MHDKPTVETSYASSGIADQSTAQAFASHPSRLINANGLMSRHARMINWLERSGSISLGWHACVAWPAGQAFGGCLSRCRLVENQAFSLRMGLFASLIGVRNATRF